ncbi:MAG: RNA methyltransferase, partial [Clostridia bacterium]|nr:RNA methyltransferase [Clostridia bacterium]
VRYADGSGFEGMTSISAVINSKHSDRKIKRVLYDGAKAGKLSRALAYLRHRADEQGFEIKETTAEELDKMTVGSSHGGIVAECTGRTLPVISAADITENGFYVYIEGVEDPYNFGYAVRSLYAAGADGVIVPERSWMSAAGVVCRSSAGASELCAVYTGCAEMIAAFKEKGYRVLCADTENAVSVYDTDCAKPVLLIVGGEKRGITRELLDKADAVVKIDYGRDFGAALSAASAAAVLGFEIMRQNRG